MKKIIIILIALVLIVISSIAWIKYNLNIKVELTESVTIEIAKGTGINETIDILENNNLLQPAWFYKLFARGVIIIEGKNIIAGNYLFKSGMTHLEIINSIMTGKHQNVLMVTFPEGIQLPKFAEIVQEKLGVDKDNFLNLANSREFLSRYGIEADNAEGYLMPDTYQFYIKQSEESILSKLINQQIKIWDEHFTKRASEMGMTRHEVLTLASIIEAETPVEEERAIVSGVYHNRLKKGMLLQADPTVQYSLGVQRRLKYSDLRYNSRYNTYIYPGLPPGPINSPSYKSIKAALFPEEHNFIYFVALGDGTGRHNFAINEQEHQRNRMIYKRNLKTNKNKPLPN